MERDELHAKYTPVRPGPALRAAWQAAYEAGLMHCMHGPDCKHGKACQVRGSTATDAGVLLFADGPACFLTKCIYMH